MAAACLWRGAVKRRCDIMGYRRTPSLSVSWASGRPGLGARRRSVRVLNVWVSWSLGAALVCPCPERLDVLSVWISSFRWSVFVLLVGSC